MFGKNRQRQRGRPITVCTDRPLLGEGAALFQSGITKPPRSLRDVALPLAGVLTILGVLAAFTAPRLLPRFYFVHEDGFVLAALVALLIGFAVRGEPRFAMRLPPLSMTMRNVVIGATLVALLLWAGTYLVFGNYPLSRDEQMVVFDMQIFRNGQLAAPLAPEWRRYVEVAPEFLLSLPQGAAWVSFYMPVNAMLRTLFGLVFDPAALNPALAAAGAVATFDCARRLFPAEREAQALAVLIYATSAQMLVTAMTPYAMTAHLALNMIWLSFYLRGTRGSHAAAIAIGFLAIGIHQIVFHPLFALAVHRASATARGVANGGGLCRLLCAVRAVLDFLSAYRRAFRRPPLAIRPGCREAAASSPSGSFRC